MRDSPARAEACWWYLVIASWTVAAKIACLASVYRHADGFVLDEIAAGGKHFARPHLLALVLARDLVETAVIAAVVYFLGWAFPRGRVAVQRACAAVLLLVMGANYLSLTELGTFVTADVLRTAWGWIWLHPSAIRAYLTPGVGVAVVLGVAGVFLPTLANRGADGVRAMRAIRRAVPISAVAVVCAGLMFSVAARAELGASAFAAQGYWERALLSVWHASETSPLASRVESESELRAEYDAIAFVPRGGGATAP